MEMTQDDTSTLGNTNSKVRARRWCFTLNNWLLEEYENIVEELTHKHSKFIIGDEIGEKCGTPHLQGYIEFENARTLLSIKKINNRMHLEKAFKTRIQNINYCSKEKILISTFPESRKSRLLKKFDEIIWKPWQQDVLNILESEPDNRTIHWFWESKGNTGKSFLCKYLAVKHDIIICEGKSNDIFNQIKGFIDEHPEEDPRMIICDIPRSSLGYLNYSTLEKVKNGCLYSGKYEGGQCIFDNPHVIIFANEPPEWRQLSMDRWKITEIKQ